MSTCFITHQPSATAETFVMRNHPHPTTAALTAANAAQTG